MRVSLLSAALKVKCTFSLCVIGSCMAICQHTAAHEEEPSGLSFCSEKYEQQGGLAKLHASNLGNAVSPQVSQVGPGTTQ